MEELDFNYLRQMAETMGKLIVEGINVNDNAIPFTMLDYYSVCNIDPEIVFSCIKRAKNKISYNNQYANFFCSFYAKKMIGKRIMDNPYEVLEQKNAFIINGERIEPTLDDIVSILNEFDNYNIPKYNRLVYTALERFAKKVPLFPLVNNREEEKLIRRR